MLLLLLFSLAERVFARLQIPQSAGIIEMALLSHRRAGPPDSLAKVCPLPLPLLIVRLSPAKSIGLVCAIGGRALCTMHLLLGSLPAGRSER